MGILGAARQRCVIPCSDGAFKIATELFPALAKGVVARTPENAVGQIRSTEAGKLDQPGLLFRSGRHSVTFDLVRQQDGGDIVTRTVAPRFGETAGTLQPEIHLRPHVRLGLWDIQNRDGRRRRRWRRVIIDVIA